MGARAPTPLTGFLQEAWRSAEKPAICVVPSLTLCGPVGGDGKIHWKQAFPLWKETDSRTSKLFFPSLWRFQKCKNMCAKTLEVVLKVCFFSSLLCRRASELQHDHAAGGGGGAHRRAGCRLGRRHPGVQTHPPQQDGEAYLPGRRVRDHRRPNSLERGRQHPGRKYLDTWQHCRKEEQVLFILAGS